MSVAIEVLLPLRNPTEAFRATVNSLLVQTDRSFSVLVGDDASPASQASAAEAVSRLQEAGIPARRISPPFALRELEQLNWLHRESSAAWVAPLLSGDWIEPQAAQRWKETIAAFPEARFIHWGYGAHEKGKPMTRLVEQCEPRFRSPEEMHESIFRFGQDFGPPGATLFLRDAWLGTGGYRQTLPLAANSLLGCELARRFGVVGIPELLSHIRFAGFRPSQRVPILKEKLTQIGMMTYHAWTERRPVSGLDLARLLAGELGEFLSPGQRSRRSL